MAARERQSRDVRSSADLAKAQQVLADSAVGIRAERRAGGARQTAGRQFRQQGRIWQDDAHRASQRVQTVEPFSQAYFAVLRRLPELESYWKEFDQVLVSGKRVSIQVSTGGAQRLTDAELTQLVADFRSR
jgi:hypothetical protein